MYSGWAFERFVKNMGRVKFPRDMSLKTKGGQNDRARI